MIADRQHAHVDHHATDLDVFVDDVVQPARHRRLVDLAHYMAGAIVLHPACHLDTRAVFIRGAPRLALDTLQIAWFLARAVATEGVLLGLGEAHAPSQTAPDPRQPFAASDSTHSEPRWTMRHHIEAGFPELIVGGSTLRWLKEWIEGAARDRAGADSLTT